MFSKRTLKYLIVLELICSWRWGVSVSGSVSVRMRMVRKGRVLRKKGRGCRRMKAGRSVKVLVAAEGWLRIEGREGWRGLAAVSEAVLEPALDHVVVVQPAVGFHHFGFTFAEILKNVLQQLVLSFKINSTGFYTNNDCYLVRCSFSISVCDASLRCNISIWDYSERKKCWEASMRHVILLH